MGAYLNALSEQKNPDVLFEQLCKQYAENEKLRAAVKDMATCDDSSQWTDETQALAMALLNGGDEALRELQRLGQEWDNDDAEQRHGAIVADQRHNGGDDG
jgi:hypothetical protein